MIDAVQGASHSPDVLDYRSDRPRRLPTRPRPVGTEKFIWAARRRRTTVRRAMQIDGNVRPSDPTQGPVFGGHAPVCALIRRVVGAKLRFGRVRARGDLGAVRETLRELRTFGTERHRGAHARIVPSDRRPPLRSKIGPPKRTLVL